MPKQGYYALKCEIMKKYAVYLPVQGSVAVDVFANDPDEAMSKGISKIESMSHD